MYHGLTEMTLKAGWYVMWLAFFQRYSTLDFKNYIPRAKEEADSAVRRPTTLVAGVAHSRGDLIARPEGRTTAPLFIDLVDEWV